LSLYLFLNNINKFLTNLIMKKIIFFAAIAMIAFTTNAVAQSSATSDPVATNATVIAPITIANTIDMSFGNLVSTVGGGDVILPTSGTRTGNVDILLGSDNGTVTAASFDITGEASYSYGITLPTSLDVTDVASSTTMAVGTFVSLPAATGSGTLSTGGTQTLLVGATITLGAGQAAGDYTNTTDMIVTVMYN
jgi:hypothetical protein